MKELSEIEVHRKAVLKAWRSMIRLKHSLAADAEINEKVPAAERVFNAGLAYGQLPDAQDIVDALAVTPDARQP